MVFTVGRLHGTETIHPRPGTRGVAKYRREVFMLMFGTEIEAGF